MAKKKSAAKKPQRKPQRKPTAEHWRIKIVTFGGGDDWHWHATRNSAAEFASRVEASREIARIRHAGADLASMEAVKVAAGTADADTLLGNVDD